MRKMLLLVVPLTIGLTACAPNHASSRDSIAIRCRNFSRSEIGMWKCTNTAERRELVDLHIAYLARKQSKQGNAPIGIAPGMVIDPKTRLKGVVDYDGAVMLSPDGETGVFLVPIHLSNGKWALLRWHVDGEFNQYLGALRL